MYIYWGVEGVDYSSFRLDIIILYLLDMSHIETVNVYNGLAGIFYRAHRCDLIHIRSH